jgi:hypothetical protein
VEAPNHGRGGSDGPQRECREKGSEGLGPGTDQTFGGERGTDSKEHEHGRLRKPDGRRSDEPGSPEVLGRRAGIRELERGQREEQPDGNVRRVLLDLRCISDVPCPSLEIASMTATIG